MKIARHPIPSTLFTYRNGTFLAQASALRDHLMSCDIVIKSDRTGAEVTFALLETKHSPSSEALELVWRGTKEHTNLRVRVLNDGVW